jgi:hypothetical protein
MTRPGRAGALCGLATLFAGSRAAPMRLGALHGCTASRRGGLAPNTRGLDPVLKGNNCHVKSRLRRAMRQRVSSFPNALRKRTGSGPQLQVHPRFLWFSRRKCYTTSSNVPPSSLSVNFPLPKSTPILSWAMVTMITYRLAT